MWIRQTACDNAHVHRKGSHKASVNPNIQGLASSKWIKLWRSSQLLSETGCCNVTPLHNRGKHLTKEIRSKQIIQVLWIGRHLRLVFWCRNILHSSVVDIFHFFQCEPALKLELRHAHCGLWWEMNVFVCLKIKSFVRRRCVLDDCSLMWWLQWSRKGIMEWFQVFLGGRRADASPDLFFPLIILKKLRKSWVYEKAEFAEFAELQAVFFIQYSTAFFLAFFLFLSWCFPSLPTHASRHDLNEQHQGKNNNKMIGIILSLKWMVISVLSLEGRIAAATEQRTQNTLQSLHS